MLDESYIGQRYATPTRGHGANIGGRNGAGFSPFKSNMVSNLSANELNPSRGQQPVKRDKIGSFFPENKLIASMALIRRQLLEP